MSRRSFVAGLLAALLLIKPAGEALAVCSGSILNPITDVCWKCIFPIKIAGITIIGGPEDCPDPVKYPICICPAPPPIFFRIGIPVAFWEPARMVEVVKDPFCFPSLGMRLGGFSRGQLQGSSSEGAGTVRRGHTFQQAHWFLFPVYALLEILVDFVCVEHTSFDVAYLTEVDPLWNDDSLAFIIQPEALLFANQIAQMACTADSVTSQVGLPLNALFWCIGSWGSSYPLSGALDNEDVTAASAGIGARMIYKLGRQGLLWDTATDLCQKVPSFIWVKYHWKFQIARPVRGRQCIPLGRSGMIWGVAKNPPKSGSDNFLFMVFRKRACCAF